MIESERLRLRDLTTGDADFILRLLNEPSFLQYIGDRGVRTLEDARRYIENGPAASYARYGFGLRMVERRADGAPLGICGLLKRELLDAPDIGFAFVPESWGQGHALEAVRATLADARTSLDLERIVAIVSPGNEASLKLLGKLGFVFERMVRMSETDPEILLLAVNEEHCR